MGEIKVGEYVRTEEGYIGKLVEYISNALNYLKIDIGREIRHCDNSVDNFIYTRYGFQIKHSPNIIDLIEVGDILKLKDGEKWEVQEHQGNGNWIQTEWEVIENEEDFKNKVDSVVTHEQFNQVKYEV